MKNLIIGLLLLPAMSFAGEKYYIDCKYNDEGETKHVQFNMEGIYEVENDQKATLHHSSLITYAGYSEALKGADVAKNVAFSRQKAVPNVKYKGTKYNNHFRFDLEWTSLGAAIEYADLIISKQPIKSEKDKSGATIRTFDGALNVSYNDHHGDSVWVICTDRRFEK